MPAGVGRRGRVRQQLVPKGGALAVAQALAQGLQGGGGGCEGSAGGQGPAVEGVRQAWQQAAGKTLRLGVEWSQAAQQSLRGGLFQAAQAWPGAWKVQEETAHGLGRWPRGPRRAAGGSPALSMSRRSTAMAGW